MGPGCPDIIQRPVWFSARDNNYVIGYKVKLADSFESGSLCEVYDKKNDEKEYYNVVDKVERESIQYLLDAIEERYNELKKDIESYYEKLKTTEKGIPINL